MLHLLPVSVIKEGNSDIERGFMYSISGISLQIADEEYSVKTSPNDK
jgi:hypothetical protein